MSSILKVDTIDEVTSANGVTVDGLSIKDSKLVTANSVVETNLTNDIVTLAKMAPGTDGNIISYDASGNPVAVATGSSGQVLTSAGAGAVPSFQASAVGGKVLQVVSAVQTSSSTGNNTSFADSGFSVTITPSATSSKILILTQIAAFNDTTATSMYYSIFRGTTNLAGASGFVRTYNGGSNLGSSVAMNFLDSPSTTSATEYSVYIKVNAGLAYISVNGATSTITALEIAG